MSIRRIDLLLPLLVVVLAGGAVALVVGLTGTSAEPGPPTPFEQETPKDSCSPFPNIQPTAPLKDLPSMPSPFGPAMERPPQKSIEEMTPEELEQHNKVEALKSRRNPFQKEKPLEEEDGGGMWPE